MWWFFCFSRFLVTPWSLSHLFSLTGESPIRQDVLMTVWASSVHGTGKKKPQRAAYCMYSLSKIKHYYRARLRNELGGLDSTDVYIYKGALLPVELSRRHAQIVVCSSPGRADHTYLDTVAQTACCQMVHFLFYSTDYSQAIAYMTTRLGAVAFTVLWCEWSTYMLCTPRTVMQGWVSNTIAIASRWP